MGGYVVPETNDRADDAYDAEVQREIDDRADTRRLSRTGWRLMLHIARSHRAAVQVMRLHWLRQRAATLFPEASELTREQWVQARLYLRLIGCRRPRVAIGSRRQERITAARTIREANQRRSA